MTKLKPYLFSTLTAFALIGGCHASDPASQSSAAYAQPAASQGDEVTPAEFEPTEPGLLPEPAPAEAEAVVAPPPTASVAAAPPSSAVPVEPAASLELTNRATAAALRPTRTTQTATVPAADPVLTSRVTGSAVSPPASTQTAAQPAPTAPDQSIVLTDEQILRVVRVIDNAEISQAELAAAKARNRRVKEFAARQLTQHMKARHRGVELATKTKITPEDSSMSDAVVSKRAKVLLDLKAARLSGFDSAYLAAQVQQLQDVLDLLASELMPAATKSELTAELQSVRSAVEAQLAEAKELEQALASPGTEQTAH
jgi:predicted outer membrane protein